MNIPNVTEIFLVRGEPITHLLLGHKKTGIGEGKWVGIGGKVEANETIEAAAIREAHEEIGVEIEPQHLQRIGTLTFVFPHKPAWSMRAHVFMAREWRSDPHETREINPEWIAAHAIHYHGMWADTPIWMPLALRGYHIDATFIFGSDNATVIDAQMHAVMIGSR